MRLCTTTTTTKDHLRAMVRANRLDQLQLELLTRGREG